MKQIYSYTKQSISYGDGWTDYRYYQCETEEEYRQCVDKAHSDVEDYTRRGYTAFINIDQDTKITARQYYSPGCGWIGRIFDAIGLAVHKRFERNDEHCYYIRPNTLVEQPQPKRKISFMDTLTDS